MKCSHVWGGSKYSNELAVCVLCGHPETILTELKEPVDQGLEREKTFGDELVDHLEHRRRLERAGKFLSRWR